MYKINIECVLKVSVIPTRDKVCWKPSSRLHGVSGVKEAPVGKGNIALLETRITHTSMSKEVMNST